MHPFLAKQVRQNVPMLLAGQVIEVDAAIASLRSSLPNEELQVYPMQLAFPGGSFPFRFKVSKAAIVQRTRLTFQVSYLRLST